MITIVCWFADGTCKTQINKIVCHPTLPIIVTGHEDKYIRFFDAKTGMYISSQRTSTHTHTLSFIPGKVIHSMTAHLDAVTGLAVDPHGLYLLSSGRREGERTGHPFYLTLCVPCRSRWFFKVLEHGHQDVYSGDHCP